jgi:hypothetical protein
MRHLLCEACGKDTPEGRRLVFEATPYEPAEWQRVVRGVARTPRPEQRVIYVNGEPFPQTPGQYECDRCNAPIAPGQPATCQTVWRADQAEPPAWEDEYLAE